MQSQDVNFEKVTAGLKTKSDKIRALARQKVPTADIARYLDIRYQHARNVLLRSGLYKSGKNEQGQGDPANSATSAWVDVDANGRLVLPADLRAKAGLTEGRVHVRLSDDGLEVLSREAALKRAQRIAAEYIPPGRSLVDEFIADRRREAANE